MTDNFKPPIKTRTTQELLKIIRAPKKWNPEAVQLAKSELSNRNVTVTKIKNVLKKTTKRKGRERPKKADESYRISDFLFDPLDTLIELLLSWELRKNGYLLKAEQQKTFRIILILSILAIFLISL
ncbi:hypothetical protein [Flavobacterium poyangense]|uniref:hypothetical protein n=1 Tax=Flavobacterium poyangense TaxID=2204302 RepID=UPI001422A8E0|nr:hypothetical protein [Flavobacterium sp. JXAS1]